MSFNNIPSADTGKGSQTKEFNDSNVGMQAFVAPLTSTGIMGWVFDIPESEEVRLENDITDHYTENNKFLNDHIVRKPIKLTLSGLIGELVEKNDPNPFSNFSQIPQGLTDIPDFEGDLTPGQKQEIRKESNVSDDQAEAINQTVDKTKNIINPFSGIDLGIKQKSAYAILNTFRNMNFPLSVMTPFSFFPMMVIETISMTQNAESASYSNIQITLKEMRFAKTETTELDESQIQRNEVQNQTNENAGTKQGKGDPTLFRIYGKDVAAGLGVQ